MRKTISALAAGAVLTLGLATAAPVVAQPTLAGAATSASAAGQVPRTLAEYRAMLDQSGLPVDLQQRIAASIDALPADLVERLNRRLEQIGTERGAALNGMARAIDPDDYACASTPLDAYVDEILAGVNIFALLFVQMYGGLDLPTYDAVLNGHTLPAEFDDGAANTLVRNTIRDAKKFWDIPSDDIVTVSMNSSVFDDDPATVTRAEGVLAVMYGADPDNPAEMAEIGAILQLIKDLIAIDPAMDGGNNPIFTLNAFAFSAADEPAGSPFAGISDRIAFGEGMFDALEAIGLGDIGVKSVLSHEFAHHVQYERDVFGTATGPEATRRTELMADAMSGYFGTHKRGLTLNAKRLVDVVRSFNYVGDCSFTSPGHHGTPNQRSRATEWGIDRAANRQKQGHIEPSQTVIDAFEAVLPQIVAPDA